MRNIAKIISWLSLGLIIAAPVLFYTEKIDLDMNKTLLMIATCVWFASALCWMGRRTS